MAVCYLTVMHLRSAPVPTAGLACAQAHLEAFTIVPSRSGVMRTWDQRIILDVLTNHMVS